MTKSHLILKTLKRPAIVSALGLAVISNAGAYELHSTETTNLNAEFLGVAGYFDSDKNYLGGTDSVQWTEAFAKYGLNGNTVLSNGQSIFGAINVVSSGTWGDGDAAGLTDGSERETDLEDAYIGWRSGDLFPSLGTDGVEASIGRQVISIGDGFIVNDDGLNLGNSLAGGELDRGGAYYLAARRAFDQTATLKLGGSEGLGADFMWFKSDNDAQASTEMAATTLSYSASEGSVEFSYIKGLDVDEEWASPAQLERDGMDIYSLRATGNAGIENANFSFEYAHQDTDSNSENAWYVEGGYTFSDVNWSPNVTYRYTRYSENWDGLFTGFSRGYGTWFQGEVAGNYAGPFNSNSGIHHAGLTLSPSETVTIGALAFRFNNVRGDSTDATELDLYVDWVAHDHLIISPLVGLYKPENSAADGGTQNDDDLNVYAQLVAVVPF